MATLANRLALATAVMSAAGAFLFVTGSACFFPWLDLYNEGITQFTVGCCLFWISSCVRVALHCQRQSTKRKWKRRRELLEPVSENVGGAVMIIACVLLYRRFPEIDGTVGIILFAAGCLLFTITPFCGILNSDQTEQANSSHQQHFCSVRFYVRSIFALNVIGNGILVVGCILFLPKFDEETLAVYLFLLGCAFLLAAALIRVIQAWTLVRNNLQCHVEQEIGNLLGEEQLYED